jgi:uncharacterized membrane protein YkvA (DUF1232 family)
MPIQITFELSDADLDYFRNVMRDAQQKMRGRDEKLILAGARKQARQLGGVAVAEFVTERLLELDALTRMLEDADWRLEGADRRRVLDALAYFAEPSDLVPDHIPGLGFLDDAIMVELVLQEMRPELDAYLEFCGWRDGERGRAGGDPEERQRRLLERRRAMYARMESRRRERARRGSWRSLFQ